MSLEQFCTSFKDMCAKKFDYRSIHQGVLLVRDDQGPAHFTSDTRLQDNMDVRETHEADDCPAAVASSDGKGSRVIDRQGSD